MKRWKLDRKRGYQDAGLDKDVISLLLFSEDRCGVSFEDIEAVLLESYGIRISAYM